MTSPDATLRFRPVAGAVIRTARRHAWQILVVSVVVSAVTVLAELAADHLLSRADLATAVAGSLSTSTVSLLGAVFLSGFLGRLVTTTEHRDRARGNAKPGSTGQGETGPGEIGQDAPRTRIRDVLRSLPWGSLILADLLVTLIILVGLLALIVPGLIAATWLAVVGPVIEIEDRSALAGLRRSARLVRPHFWRVVEFATLPLLLANGIVGVLPDPSGASGVLITLVVRSVGEAVLDSIVGLLLVELCYRLIAAERAAARLAARPGSLPIGGA